MKILTYYKLNKLSERIVSFAMFMNTLKTVVKK